MLQVNHLYKSYKTGNTTYEVLKDVSFSIEEGEFVAVMGPSGSGKTTLLNCISCFIPHDKGEILLDGVNISNMKEEQIAKIRNEKLGFVFQDFMLLDGLNVFENVCVPKVIHQEPYRQMETKAEKLLKMFDIADIAKKFPAEISGGQKQRVAIARALANDPKVLLCDEATSALDPQTTQSILKLLKKVNEEMGITIVLITHEMAVVKDICDRVAIMEEGTVVEAGNTVDVFSHPQVRITRDFIDTASNIRKIYDLIEDKNELTQIGAGDRMLLFTYSGANAGEPLISYLAKAFDIRANIIFGNIDFLKGKPLGKLVVTLSGEADKMEKAMEYINSLGVEVEVIKE